mmetsp:Transcript_57155/g.134530  ORF Transcript_57155/g.134530 Transcript_57155/m.134530 type:complete len:311 (-) Transcript_57155:39-971(-)
MGSVTEAAGYTPGSRTRISSCYQVWHVDSHDVKLIQVVGAGSYCKVWRGMWRGLQVAVKEHLLAGSAFIEDEDVQAFYAEAEMLSNLRHPHILQFYGATITDSNMLILTELCSFGSLRQVLSDDKIGIPVDRRLNISRQVALGMNYLHTRAQAVVHRDLKSPNVLLTNQWVAKVADFGVARVYDDRRNMTQGLGSTLWSAPEVLQKSRYSVAADVYAYGVILWEVASRHEPYEGMSPSQVALAVVQGTRPDISVLPPDTSELLVGLMTDCWDVQPVARPNFTAVLRRLDEIAGQLGLHVAQEGDELPTPK